MEATARSRGWEGASRTGLVVLVVGLGFVIANLDATIVNVATVTIGRSLGAGVGRVAWVVNAYVLAFAMFLLISGDLAGKFGARRIFLAGVGVFILASVASALSVNAPCSSPPDSFRGSAPLCISPPRWFC